jgi:ABC-type histidine transport system ATPase subunit
MPTSVLFGRPKARCDPGYVRCLPKALQDGANQQRTLFDADREAMSIIADMERQIVFLSDVDQMGSHAIEQSHVRCQDSRLDRATFGFEMNLLGEEPLVRVPIENENMDDLIP